jgi:large repetitive protein
MTNTKTTTTTKTSHLFRALTALLAMLAAMMLAGGTALAATTFSNSSAIQIPDSGAASPYPSQINAQNLSGTITDVDVGLGGFSHVFPDDVDALLVGPHGQKALLMSDVGGADDANNANLTLDDEATNSLPDQSLITSGAYKPTQGTPGSAGGETFPSPAPAGPYATDLSVFDGSDPNGTWSLYVKDDTPRDAGGFAGGWSLGITTDAPQPDTTAPRVNSTFPQPGATGVSPTANVSAIFSEDMKASTINTTTFKLFRKGSTTKLAATITLNANLAAGTANGATLDPTNSLKRGVTYKAVVTTGAKDVAGNSLDQNSTLYGLQQKVWTFTVKQ